MEICLVKKQGKGLPSEVVIPIHNADAYSSRRENEREALNALPNQKIKRILEKNKESVQLLGSIANWVAGTEGYALPHGHSDLTQYDYTDSEIKDAVVAFWHRREY